MSESAGKSPFEILEVALDADDATIRKAYAKKLRSVRESGDPDLIQEVQQAFEQIRDEDSRQKLLEHLHVADDLEPVLEEIRSAIDDGDDDKTLELFQQALFDFPKSEKLRWFYYEYQVHSGNFHQAIVVIRKLTSIAPDNPIYQLTGAECCLRASFEVASNEERREQLVSALEFLREGQRLGADGIGVAILEARVCRARGDHAAAAKLLQSRLASDSHFDSGQLAIALELLRLHGERGQQQEFTIVLDRVATYVSDSDDRNETIAVALCDLAEDIRQFALPAAVRCTQLAVTLQPSNEGMAEFSNHLEAVHGEVQSRVESARAFRPPGLLQRAWNGARARVNIPVAAIMIVVAVGIAFLDNSGDDDKTPAEKSAEEALEKLRERLRESSIDIEKLREMQRPDETLEEFIQRRRSESAEKPSPESGDGKDEEHDGGR